MSVNEILLALDGSIYSKYAAATANRLSCKHGAGITALHVVDLDAAAKVLGGEVPGFLESTQYQVAYASVLAILSSLGEKLLGAYSEEASYIGLEPTVIMDQAVPYESICKRAMNYDLVVIGHKPEILRTDDNGNIEKHSLAESLAHGCPKPLLIVQAPTADFKTMTILVSADHINKGYIEDCLRAANSLQLQPLLTVVTTGVAEESPEAMIRDLRESDELLNEIPIAITKYSGGEIDELQCWDSPTGAWTWGNLANTLVTIPTRELSGRRTTIVSTSSSFFLRCLNLPCLLLHPEDSAHLIKKPCPTEATLG